MQPLKDTFEKKACFNIKISLGRVVSNGNGSHENGAEVVVVVERDVNVTGKAIEADLDALQAEIRAQTAGLEKCLEQLDTYQQVRLMVLGVMLHCVIVSSSWGQPIKYWASQQVIG